MTERRSRSRSRDRERDRASSFHSISNNVGPSSSSGGSTHHRDRDATPADNNTNDSPNDLIPRVHSPVKLPDESKLFIGNLGFDIRDKDIFELFSKFGKILDARVIMDRFTGRSRGFGFVSFAEVKSADEAYNSMQNYLIQGRELRLDRASTEMHQRGEPRHRPPADDRDRNFRPDTERDQRGPPSRQDDRGRGGGGGGYRDRVDGDRGGSFDDRNNFGQRNPYDNDKFNHRDGERLHPSHGPHGGRSPPRYRDDGRDGHRGDVEYSGNRSSGNRNYSHPDFNDRDRQPRGRGRSGDYTFDDRQFPSHGHGGYNPYGERKGDFREYSNRPPEGRDHPYRPPEGRDYSNRDFPNRPPEGRDYPNRPPESRQYSNRPPEGRDYSNRPPEGRDYSNRFPPSNRYDDNRQQSSHYPIDNRKGGPPPNNYPKYEQKSQFSDERPPYHDKAPNPGICYQWQKGECRFGNNCRFLHEGPRGQNRSIPPNMPPTAENPQAVREGDGW